MRKFSPGHDLAGRIHRHPLVAILLLTVVVRLGTALAMPQLFAFERTGVLHGSSAYDGYARNLLATGVYGQEAGVPDAALPPLYSLVLAGIYGLLGRGGLQVVMLNTLLDCASILLLAQIGRRLLAHGQAVGALAALFTALYPYLVFQSLTVIDTSLFVFWLHAFALLLILLRERERLDGKAWLLAGLGGLILGLTMLTRPVMPPLALLAALWFLWRRGLWQTLARLLPVALVMLLVMLPWLARSHALYGVAVMTTTGGGNFWQGNHENSARYLRAGYDVQWTVPEPSPPGLNAQEYDAWLMTQGLDWLRANPGQLPELLWLKFLVQWSIDITPRRNPGAGAASPQAQTEGELTPGGLGEADPVLAYSTPLFDIYGRWIHRLYFGPLLALALVGLWRTRRQWREVSLLWFAQIGMTVVYLVFHPSTRYRAPTDPLLFLFSAVALVAGWQIWRGRPAAR